MPAHSEEGVRGLTRLSGFQRTLAGLGACGFAFAGWAIWHAPSWIDLALATIACAVMVILGAFRAIYGENP